MPLISRHKEVQLHLNTIYDNLQNSVDKLKIDLSVHRNLYEEACSKHINSGYKLDKLWQIADSNYQNKFREFETHCFLLDILTDHRDEEGNFNHIEEILLSLESLIKQFINQEAYEVCAMIKKWSDYIKSKYDFQIEESYPYY